ncbi:chitinase-3-like protein 1 [Anopheles marshallii]|uniref:chitinase-3-like protein 1 n=1 Tax=Anopheles marshallii TaxID=1521116 RepID=UPI00237B002D|nr:chitinase-3-like protein 1 [Anopheles marshallii]
MPRKLVFGFYSSWARYRNGRGKCMVSDINPHLCTHLIYAFGQLEHGSGIGSVARPDESERDTMLQFNDLRNQNRNLKTLISFGGAHDGGPTFSSIAASSQLRSTFARNVRIFCATYGFNGVDIDWEFPLSYDLKNFVQLLSTLSSELHGHGLLLTASVGVNREYEVAGIARHVDYILLMTYDYNGSWDSSTGHNAPLSWGQVESEYQRKLNVKESVKYWVRGGAPRSKLIVGLAAYGRTFTLSYSGSRGTRADARGAGREGPYTKEAGILAYYEVKDAFGSDRIWDSEQCVPYALSGDQWVSYDDPQSIRLKCEYIQSEGLGGAMMWSIDQDEFQKGFTLLQTVADCL